VVEKEFEITKKSSEPWLGGLVKTSRLLREVG